jgi:type IV pilus assembly protein PilA
LALVHLIKACICKRKHYNTGVWKLNNKHAKGAFAMLSNRKLKKDGGFTIIEVMIVLAIAALILVVVLVAIPQLQRNQRNNARQNDTSRVLTAVQSWSSNNNGKPFPGTTGADFTSARDAVRNDIGSLTQYDVSVNNVWQVGSGAQAALNDDQIDRFRIVAGAKCGENGVTVAGTTRQVVVQYVAETANGVQGRCTGEF